MAEKWCLDAFSNQKRSLPTQYGIFLDCSTQSERLGIPYSGIPMTTPTFTACLDIICLLFFSYIKATKYCSRKSDTYIVVRELIFSLLVLISLIDNVVFPIIFKKQSIGNFLRPIIVVLLFRSQQDFFHMVALNIKDSTTMLCCIMIWVAYFSVLGSFIFSDTMEGLIFFPNFTGSFWSMFVCLTTEDFPDVLFLALKVRSIYSIFFIIFILVGVFFLLNVLLAVIFDNFKSRVEISREGKANKRIEYINQFFDKFDEEGKGWLNLNQTKSFFALVLDLNYKKPAHNKMFSKI